MIMRSGGCAACAWTSSGALALSLTAWLAVLPVEAAADVAAGAGRAAAAPLATWSAATAEPPVVVGANTFGTGALQATLVRTKSMGTAATSGRMRRRGMWSVLLPRETPRGLERFRQPRSGIPQRSKQRIDLARTASASC